MQNLTTLDSHPCTTKRTASHSVIIVLSTKLDAECDRQVTVISQMSTTLDDDRCAITKLFLIQRLDKSSRGNYAYVWRYLIFIFIW